MKKYLFIIVLFFLLSDCKKYPEDSKWIHLRTVEGRLCKKWGREGDAYNFVTNQYTYNPNLTFFKGGSVNGDFIGKWELTDSKKKLILTAANYVTWTFTIEKLDNNALWFQNDSVLYKFVPFKK